MRYKTLLVIVAAVILATLTVRTWQHKHLPSSSTEASQNPAKPEAEAPPETLIREPDSSKGLSSENPGTGGATNGGGVSNDLLREFEATPANQSLRERLDALARQGYSLGALTQQALMQASNMVQEASRTMNHPIEFYGKVVNESGAPVAGAHAEFSCQGYPQEHWTTNLLSASDGTFALMGGTGAFLYVHIALEGYEEVSNTNQNKFEYYSPLPTGGFKSDPKYPVVFHVRRKE